MDNYIKTHLSECVEIVDHYRQKYNKNTTIHLDSRFLKIWTTILLFLRRHIKKKAAIFMVLAVKNDYWSNIWHTLLTYYNEPLSRLILFIWIILKETY